MRPGFDRMWVIVGAEVPGQQVDNALTTIASQGILGAVCLLLIVALFYSIKGWLKAKDDRVNDQQIMTRALQGYNEEAKNLAIELNAHAATLATETAKSNEGLRSALTTALTGFQQEQTRTTNALTLLQQEQVRLGSSFRCEGKR